MEGKEQDVEQRRRENIRNVAVIAHVDHGKTTLVDGMLRQSGLLSRYAGDADRVLDSFDLERERGITILAKNTAVDYKNYKINILDTPGHHDFGGEVERTLVMADGVLLLVDAAEGPLPQTRFVLQKALTLNLPVIVAINKIDRKDARCEEVLNAVYDLFIDLEATEAQIDFPVLYTNGKGGTATTSLEEPATDLTALFETLISAVPGPLDRSAEPLQFHVTNLAWDEYVGRVSIGRVHSGFLAVGSQVYAIDDQNQRHPARILRIYHPKGLIREEVSRAQSGDIISLAGIDQVNIGDTIVDDPQTPALERIRVDEPTVAMQFCVNNGPFAGKEGKWVTSRKIRERLFKESMANVAIRVEETQNADIFRVIGRGELQLGILVETMRREGYELMLSRPEVVTREIDGQRHEPVELLQVDCAVDTMGPLSELIGPRKGILLEMEQSSSRVRVVYRIPTRGLIGLHSDLLTETRGTAVANTSFDGWIPWQGPIPTRSHAALVADRMGKATPYAIFHLQPRGMLFIEPGIQVYEGMVIGQTPRSRDIDVNVTREKKLTNIRAAAKDENVILAKPRKLSLEQAIEFINNDEFVEVTPQSIRMRKKVLQANRRLRPAVHAPGPKVLAS
ncbi:MAG: translational GTPase TypA [Myxococcota bacterium]|nr:translational GTPase TypA [Myxococcota bacterium]